MFEKIYQPWLLKWAVVGGGVLVLVLLWSSAAQAAVQPPFVYVPEECGWWNRCPVPAPTILGPVMGEEVGIGPVTVRGLTWNHTKIEIYLDGKLVGWPQVTDSLSTDTTGFSLTLLPLTVGVHRLYAIARSFNSWERSPDSFHYEFLVVAPYPALTLIQPLAAPEAGATILRGFVRNHSVLEVVFDKEPLAPIVLDNSSSPPTVHFIVALPPTSWGVHQVGLVALDAVTGKKSQVVSAVLEVTKAQPRLMAPVLNLVASAVPVARRVKGTDRGSVSGQPLPQAVVPGWQPQSNVVTAPTSLTKAQRNRLFGLVLAVVFLVVWFGAAVVRRRLGGQPPA
ncbi:MAG: hypothetical protein HY974_02120 [Candidatus Kerfeldbacteria bacterium]|nr:hypothetical protein [Candidatus Kerfeldbacteria bacterium]